MALVRLRTCYPRHCGLYWVYYRCKFVILDQLSCFGRYKHVGALGGRTGLMKVEINADTVFETGEISDAEQAKGRHDRGVVMGDIESNLL